MPGTRIGGNQPSRVKFVKEREEGGGEDVAVEVPTGKEEGGFSELSVEELEELLDEAGVEISSIEGTGSSGGVVKADLIRALEELDEDESEDEEDD